MINDLKIPSLDEWLNNNEFAISIWKRKYRQGDETFPQWIRRVSGGDEALARLILKKRFIPAGRILTNRGIAVNSSTKGTYSNCYVMPAPADNLESIFDTMKNAARTYSYGGGVGVDLSNLAPAGAKVQNAAKTSTGAVSFMDMFSDTTGLIAQNGRRGAMMISMACDHPDIEAFIDIKTDLSRVKNANISVRATNEFMDKARNDIESGNTEPDFELSFYRPETNDTITKFVNAGELLRKIAENNWRMGEPGLLFWDTISGWNLVSEYPEFEYAGVNPCAEEPLPAYGSCLLGSINLSEYVLPDKMFDFVELRLDMKTIVRAMNDILDEGISLHPLAAQQQCAREWRQIGIGVMGIADMLVKMELVYGSDASLTQCANIAEHILNYAMFESSLLAKEKGKFFPKFSYEHISASEFYQNNVWTWVDDEIKQHGLYNSQLLTIAPTGSISNLLGVSGGIEPYFAIKYRRKTESLHGKETYYDIYTPAAQRYIDEHGGDTNLPEWFVTAADIDWYSRLNMQGTWQSFIDASISSTVNLPSSATVDDIVKLYLTAHELGLKGVTVFREGCERDPVLSKESKDKDKPKQESANNTLARGVIVPASENDIGIYRGLQTGCGTLHLTAFFNRDTGELVQTYLNKGSTGGCNSFMVGLSRMISLAARGGCSTASIIDQLTSTPFCKAYDTRKQKSNDTSPGCCCPDAVGRALRDMWQRVKTDLGMADQPTTKQTEVCNESTQEQPTNKKEKEFAKSKWATCPNCGTEIQFSGGCWTCPNCGEGGCE